MLSNKLTLKFLWFHPKKSFLLLILPSQCGWWGVGVLLHTTLSNQSAGW